MERRFLANTYITKMCCDKCGGDMVADRERAVASYPPKYLHICSNCKNAELFDKAYPNIEYELLNEVFPSEPPNYIPEEHQDSSTQLDELVNPSEDSLKTNKVN